MKKPLSVINRQRVAVFIPNKIYFISIKTKSQVIVVKKNNIGIIYR